MLSDTEPRAGGRPAPARRPVRPVRHDDGHLGYEALSTGDEAHVRLQGVLDLLTAHLVRERLMAAATGELVVDLSGVEAIDVAGFALLVAATRRCHEHGHRLLLRGVSADAEQILEHSGLGPYLQVQREALPVPPVERVTVQDIE